MDIFNRCAVIGLAFCLQLTFSLTAQAQSEAERNDSAVIKQSTVEFEVTPPRRMGAVLTPNARTPPPPEPLTPAARSDVIGSASAAGEAPEARSKFLLSAAYAVHEDKGVLTLVQPHTVHPETGIHMRGSSPGSVGVKVKVEAGNRYLVDFYLKSGAPGRYLANVEGTSREVEDPSGQLEHLLVVLNANDDGWTTVRLSRPETDFMLYGVEVSQFDGEGE